MRFLTKKDISGTVERRHFTDFHLSSCVFVSIATAKPVAENSIEFNLNYVFMHIKND